MADADNASPSASNSNQRSRKRKKSRVSSQEDVMRVQQERYDRLLYTSKKQVRRQAKQVKNFLLQKGIRKQQHDGKEELSALKSLDLDIVVQQSLRQLGLYHCNPSLKVAPDDDDEAEGTDDSRTNQAEQSKTPTSGAINPSKAAIPASLSPDDPNHALVNAILTHKRFLQMLQDWNAKVAEYRQ
ncbi:MAG: hypothetical protein SGARI_007463, partial [Bacillariaceae sp.]